MSETRRIYWVGRDRRMWTAEIPIDAICIQIGAECPKCHSTITTIDMEQKATRCREGRDWTPLPKLMFRMSRSEVEGVVVFDRSGAELEHIKGERHG